MLDHFVTSEEARAAVEPFLRTWEFWDDLNGRNGLRFVYAGASFVDRNPPPRAAKVVYAEAASTILTGDNAEPHASRSLWPAPPQNVKLSSEVELLHQRWVSYHEHRELLTQAAYLALTILETVAKLPVYSSTFSRKPSKARLAAATQCNIDIDVLSKLGELTAEKGGSEARKAEGVSSPLTPSERDWVEAAFKQIIIKLAERAYHGKAPPRPLTIADLPKLDSP